MRGRSVFDLLKLCEDKRIFLPPLCVYVMQAREVFNISGNCSIELFADFMQRVEPILSIHGACSPHNNLTLSFLSRLYLFSR